MNVKQILKDAIAKHRGGDLGAAESLYKQILEKEPKHPNTLNFLGVLKGQTGEHDRAVELLRAALKEQPD